MSELDDALTELRAAAQALAAHDEARPQLRDRRDKALRRAGAAGATYAVMQDAGRVSNVTVTNALKER